MIQAAILSRSLFENSARLLWAAKAPGRWEHLHKYWAYQDLVWAKEAETFTGTKMQSTGRVVQKDRKEFLKGFKPEGMHLQEMLADIQQDNKDRHPYYYTAFYRQLCRAAHVHIHALFPKAGPVALIRDATWGAYMATVYLLFAKCAFFGIAPTRKSLPDFLALMEGIQEMKLPQDNCASQQDD